ncbi:MAG: ubiquinone/menaquinone biosynthesis methyltransferase [Phycisphaerae bacterium]|nr:ubiquinone/menaquinone biosynthesis methyltransferase [Gemmatimonadaceae bacterium]
MNDSSAGSGQGANRKDKANSQVEDHTATMERPIRLGSLDLEAHLSDPDRKQQFVTPMFDVIAPRYDVFTRMFSFGMDAGWKRDALKAAIENIAGRGEALDLACGTGDFVLALANASSELRVTGIDASPRMIDIANARIGAGSVSTAVRERVSARVGDMMRLDVADQSVDVITAGYGVRNVPDPATAVREMARVLKPGGTLVTMDFYRPELALWRALLLGYLSVAGNVVGWWWHRDPVVYGYISRSIEHFMSWQAFSGLLEQEGFALQRVVRHLGGGLAMHVATRR